MHVLGLLLNVMVNVSIFVATIVWQCLCWPSCIAWMNSFIWFFFNHGAYNIHQWYDLCWMILQGGWYGFKARWMWISHPNT